MGHSFAHLMAEHKPAPLKITPQGRVLAIIPPDSCPVCRCPTDEHYGINRLDWTGCPREQTALSDHLDAVLRGSIMGYGAFGTEALLDHIEQIGLPAVRARLVALLAKGTR